MPGHRLDLTIEKGASWINTLYLTDADNNTRDLSGYTAGMMIRPSKTSNTVLQYLSTASGNIIIEGTAGRIYFYLSPEQTATIGSTYMAKGEYDLELYGPTNCTIEGLPTLGVERVIYGVVSFINEVTR